MAAIPRQAIKKPGVKISIIKNIIPIRSQTSHISIKITSIVSIYKAHFLKEPEI